MKMRGLWSAAAALACFATVTAARPALADGSGPAATVVIDNFSFNPPKLTVAAGSTVTWKNQDDMPHTIVNDASPREFKSPPLDSGEQFSWTFSKPGTYSYFCSIHPKMIGVVTVK
jgi:plastocyanin